MPATQLRDRQSLLWQQRLPDGQVCIVWHIDSWQLPPMQLPEQHTALPLHVAPVGQFEAHWQLPAAQTSLTAHRLQKPPSLPHAVPASPATHVALPRVSGGRQQPPWQPWLESQLVVQLLFSHAWPTGQS